MQSSPPSPLSPAWCPWHHQQHFAAIQAGQQNFSPEFLKRFCRALPRVAAGLSPGYLPTSPEGCSAQHSFFPTRCSAVLAGQRVVQQLTTWLGSPNALWRRCTRAPRASGSPCRRRPRVTSCRVVKVSAAYLLRISLAQMCSGLRHDGSVIFEVDGGAQNRMGACNVRSLSIFSLFFRSPPGPAQ